MNGRCRVRGTRLLAALVGLWALAAVAKPAPAKPSGLIVQEATGEAAIVGGNATAAIQQATEAAVREAVQQAAGVILESDTVTANSQLVRDQISTHSQGYVHGYQVLSKTQEAGVAKVTVRVEVGRQGLDRDLVAIKGLIKRLENKKLVIYLNETALRPDHTSTHSSTLATVLTEAFQKDGWTLIDPAFLAGKVQLTAGVEQGATQLREMGNNDRADYIVYGTVNYIYEEPTGPLAQLMFVDGKQTVFPVNGTYELAVFATDNGSLIAKLSETFDDKNKGKDAAAHPFIPEASLSYDEAAMAAVKRNKTQILGKVRGAVVSYLKSAELDGRRIELHVSGISYAKWKAFLAELAAKDPSVRGTTNSKFDHGTAQADLQFVGTSDELADRLGRIKFEKRSLEVTSVSGNKVEAAFTK